MMGWNGNAGMWFASRNGQSIMSSNFETVWFFAMGYGCDQAASLRYLMDEINKN